SYCFDKLKMAICVTSMAIAKIMIADSNGILTNRGIRRNHFKISDSSCYALARCNAAAKARAHCLGKVVGAQVIILPAGFSLDIGASVSTKISEGSTFSKSLRAVPSQTRTPPTKPALPSRWDAIGVVMKRNKMARAILIHVLHDGS